ncbi:MAG: signal peptide peptidase SppA [Methyloligellaceae bacterium]
MSLDAESVVERRQLRRRVGKWRILAIAALLFAVFVIFGRMSGSGVFGKTEQIARIEISGLITEDHRQLKMLDEIAEADHVTAVLLRVNSPGGTTTGGEALYEAIRKISKKKPVVAVFGTVAASAAYIVGIASDHIVSRGNSITGSVGVIFQWAEVHDALAKLGVRMNEVKSGDLKASPSMFRPLDENSKALVDEMVAESHRWFIDLVKERRKVSESDVPGLVNGRIYSGREALRLKLVDEIGGEAEAVAWLESKRSIKSDLPVEQWKIDRMDSFGLLGRMARWTGWSDFSLERILEQEPLLQRLRLDGLVSVWQFPKK